MPSQLTNNLIAETLVHTGLPLTKGNAAPTQIDTELASDTSQVSVPHDRQSEPSQGSNLLTSSAQRNTIKEAEGTLAHHKDGKNAEALSQSIQQILQAASVAVPLVGDHPNSTAAAGKNCQYIDGSPPMPDTSVPSVPTTEIDKSTQEILPDVSDPLEFDCRLDNSVIEEINMQGAKAPTTSVQELLPNCNTAPTNLCTSSICSVQNEQPEKHEIYKDKSAINSLDDPTVPPAANVSSSITERRFLARMHTLKQLVASKESLVNMEFGEDDLAQAAKLYDNLNATACFYTTALRLLSKADWQERVDFEEHIVHQAMIAVARGWTTAVGVKALSFDRHYLALSMATLPPMAHGEVKRTFDSIVTTLPSPFREKASSIVAFTCRNCGKKASHEIPTFIVLEAIMPQASDHDLFNAAVPWSESLLPGSAEAIDDPSPNCDECASNSSWIIETEARCKLVWLQFPRESHPQALQYSTFLGKDPFFVKGLSWRCISLVVHQGYDPLYGDNQPADHFYVLENEGPKCKSVCYNNAVSLHYIDDTRIKIGDSICALLYRTTDIVTKWPTQCTFAIQRAKNNTTHKPDKGKRIKNGRGPKVLLSSKKRATPKKQPPQQTGAADKQSNHDTYASEKYGPPEDDIIIVPTEAIDSFEEAFSQPQSMPQVTLTSQQENGDPCRCSSAASGTPQRPGSSPTRPGPYTTENSKSGIGCDKATSTTASSPGAAESSKPPYAILIMFDGCGSSVDIIESKIGYRPKACILCEKDETLRYLVGEKHGISVDQIWQHSSRGGGAFYYANDVDHLFTNNARLLREFVALCSDCNFLLLEAARALT